MKFIPTAAEFTINQANQVWALDTTYIPMAKFEPGRTNT
jgi:hypothetical protein